MSKIADTLRSLPYFSDLDETLLNAVADKSRQVEVSSETSIIDEGSSSSEMYVIVEGEVRVVKNSAGKEVELARLVSGDVVGEIALLDQAPRTASVIADASTTVVEVPADAFELLLSDPHVVRRMFRTVTSRLRGIETTLRHEERMAALGRMAAQLMHELNNPAAAVGRSSQSLTETTERLFEHATDLTTTLTGGVDLTAPVIEGKLSALDASEREDELVGYLEDLGVDDGWDYAQAMVEVGWSADALREKLATADEPIRAALARWTGLRLLAAQLSNEISIAAGRVSELVRVVKDYSYVDQAPIQSVDVTKGIEDTLILMKHKLKTVEVVTQFAGDLPEVEAPGRDLNQIWTNLIDNAADAMEEDGTLTVSTEQVDGEVVVKVMDTGPGMPDEVSEKIFDPFFTTKEPGKGTGLGLHTVHTIVQRIGGEISVESSPAGTTFTVSFPLS